MSRLTQSYGQFLEPDGMLVCLVTVQSQFVEGTISQDFASWGSSLFQN